MVKEYHIYIHSTITTEYYERLENALVQLIRDFRVEGELISIDTNNRIFIAVKGKEV